jgi:glycine/serine hydroxymethyltransferase
VTENATHDLRAKLGDLADRTVDNNLWRQRRCFNLIPSEQTPSHLVKLFEIADPAGRYAEHRRQKGREVYYYQGTDFIRDVEDECRRELGSYFGCEEVELRPISGQMANEVVYKALVRYLTKERGEPNGRLRRVINHDLKAGGHLSAQPMGALFNFVDRDPESGKEAVTNFPTLAGNAYKTDVPRLLEVLEETRPDLVIFGKSMFLYREPVAEVAKLVADWPDRPVLHFDMAHVLGLYGGFQRPFQEGADLVTGSTHKTFFGTQRGVVAANLPEGHALRRLWIEIKNRAFPGSTSNHHLGTLLGLLAASIEMNHFRDEYQSQVLRNARAFAGHLAEAGIAVEGDASDGYTETHQVICRVREWGDGEEVARRLENNNIIVNYQALPDDESFLSSSGIRIGVAEMTRFGMKEDDFAPLAGLVAEVVREGRDVAERVARLREPFCEMGYCLPASDVAEMGSRLLASIFPDDDLASRFAEALRTPTARVSG